jgi:hypothetical protein
MAVVVKDQILFFPRLPHQSAVVVAAMLIAETVALLAALEAVVAVVVQPGPVVAHLLVLVLLVKEMLVQWVTLLVSVTREVAAGERARPADLVRQALVAQAALDLRVLSLDP